jgi:predicted amidohydrolase
MTVTMAIAQVTPIWEDPGATLGRVFPLIRQASERNADIICFPEQFATGWDPGSSKNAETADGRIVSGLAEAARDNSIAVLGSFRLSENGSLYNACVAIGPEGKIIGLYKKIHLFSPHKEGGCYSPGDDITIISISDMEFGVAICYDLRFSSLFHIYAAAGVDGVLVPAAWPASRMEAWELFIRSHAVEDQMYVVGINTTGTTPVDKYEGGSLVAGPDGEIVTRVGTGEGLTFALLDGDRVGQARRAIPVSGDRRPGLYHEIYKKKKQRDTK